MMPPTPPLTLRDLLDGFDRYAPDENIAGIRVAQADYCERMAVQRLEANRNRGRRMGIIADMDWRP
jgi:hypothetical protein